MRSKLFFPVVYLIMSLGLILTFLVGLVMAIFANTPIMAFLFELFPVIFILELVVVLVLSFAWKQLNSWINALLFIVYAIMNGVFFGILFLAYDLNSLISAFLICGITFVVLSLFGYFVKQDLSFIGMIGIFGLVGVLVASLVNLIIYFINPQVANGISLLLNYVVVAVFVILTAYDTQKLKLMESEAVNSNQILKFAVRGALMLYLDFINLFIRILRITGKRR